MTQWLFHQLYRLPLRLLLLLCHPRFRLNALEKSIAKVGILSQHFMQQDHSVNDFRSSSPSPSLLLTNTTCVINVDLNWSTGLMPEKHTWSLPKINILFPVGVAPDRIVSGVVSTGEGVGIWDCNLRRQLKVVVTRGYWDCFLRFSVKLLAIEPVERWRHSDQENYMLLECNLYSIYAQFLRSFVAF